MVVDGNGHRVHGARVCAGPGSPEVARAFDILEQHPGAVCVVRAADLSVLYLNRAWAELMQVEAPALPGRPIGEAVRQGGEALLNLLVAAGGSGAAARVSNFRVSCDGGSERLWTVQLTPRFDDRGERVAEIMVFITDVSERAYLVQAADRAAEQERRRAEQFDAVFASIASAVVLADNAGIVRKCNEAAVALFGLEEGSGLGVEAPELALVRPDGGAMGAHEAPLARALRGEVVRGEEAVVLRPGHPQRAVSVAAAPVMIDGAVTGAVAVFHDISEIRSAEERMERALQAERRRAREARTLYHAARATSSGLDLQECLHAVAATMAEAVGVSRCHIVLLEGETIKGFAAFGAGPEQIAQLQSETRHRRLDCARGLQAVREHRPVYVADATTDPLGDHERARALAMKSVLVVPLVYGAHVTGVGYLDEPGVEREFSESNRAMASTIGAQGAVAIENARLYEVEQGRARMLEIMMAELNHRVKNNLAVVSGLLALQLSQGDPAATKESVLRDCMTRIQSIALIHQLLHAEDLDAVDMKETARRIASMVAETFSVAGQRITCRVRGDRLMLPCKLATSLGVALNELLCNAVKHGLAGREQGRVTVSITAGERICITVSDNGRGLRPGFDAGRDGHLGVLVMDGLVEGELGGSFTLRNRARGGTTAVIAFPAAAARR